MRKMILAMLVFLFFIPNNSFAGGEKVVNKHPYNYDQWTAFQNHQHDELAVFLKQLNLEKENYLKAHPDIASQARQQAQTSEDLVKQRHLNKLPRRKYFKT